MMDDFSANNCGEMGYERKININFRIEIISNYRMFHRTVDLFSNHRQGMSRLWPKFTFSHTFPLKCFDKKSQTFEENPGEIRDTFWTSPEIPGQFCLCIVKIARFLLKMKSSCFYRSGLIAHTQVSNRRLDCMRKEALVEIASFFTGIWCTC